MNATIVNTSGANHTAQADPTNVRNAGVPIFTGTLLTKGAEESIVPIIASSVEEDCAFVVHKEHEEIK